MNHYLLLYSGPPVPSGSSHAGWPEWFSALGEALVDRGSPAANGVVLHPGGMSEEAAPLRGYSILRAESREAAVALTGTHPLLTAGSSYTVELFELPARAERDT